VRDTSVHSEAKTELKEKQLAAAQSQAPLKEGKPCDWESETECEQGLTCIGAVSDEYTCFKLREDKEECEWEWQCKSSFCLPRDNQYERECASEPLSEGKYCEEEDECETGLVCKSNGWNSEKYCLKEKEVGEECDEKYECREGLHCVRQMRRPRNAGFKSTCSLKLHQKDEFCGGDDDCDEGLTCNMDVCH